MRRSIGKVLMLLVLSLMMWGMVSAQDDAARQMVLDAVSQMGELDGYHFDIKYQYVQEITEENGNVIKSVSLQNVQGDIAQNGDYQSRRVTQDGTTFEEAVEAAPYTVEQIAVDGQMYLNIDMTGSIHEETFPVEAGWWRLEDLLETLETAGERFVVEGFAQPELEIASLFEAETILSVTEAEAETVNGVAMRVFDVELDAIRQTPSTDEMTAEEWIAENQELIEASDIRLHYRLWIGAEDGLIYSGRGEQRMVIPYLTAGKESDPPYDLSTITTVDFALSQHGEAVSIEPPDESVLNS